ncbi:MAG: hypothetical protein LH630_02560 [Actinomycetia bacterium]|nr:hypothetical protein [Actinomycetes bacterium]
MYGTVMIAKVKGSVDEMRARAERWAEERGETVGYVDQNVLVSGDGRIVVAIRFDSKAQDEALADDPAQDKWWRAEMAPLLDGDPEWIDGEWQEV